MDPSTRRQLEVLTTLAFPILIPLLFALAAALLIPWVARWLQ